MAGIWVLAAGVAWGQAISGYEMMLLLDHEPDLMIKVSDGYGDAATGDLPPSRNAGLVGHTYIDEIVLQGIPEPAPLLLTALGALAMRRRIR